VADVGAPGRIVLVGFMGSGKSTVGRMLARELHWGFLDMDRRVEERCGMRIPEIFAERGEAFFRQQEREVAEEIRGASSLVVATGGGAFAFEETREALRAGALVVWLWAPIETILSRVRLDGSRPLAGSRERILHLFAERQPSYRLAECHVDATAGPEEVVRRVRQTVGR
jgi:shikimate kinase